MSFFKNIFGKPDAPVRTYADFWTWFLQHEKAFLRVLNDQADIEKNFFNKVSPKLEELYDGMLLLAGTLDDRTADLIFTADGDLKRIAFVEELVQAAPSIPGWKISALKPPVPLDNMQIKMNGFLFDRDTLSFYPNDNRDYPDEVDITVVHKDLREENRQKVVNGVYIFLDNYLGELNFVESIDRLTIAGPHESGGKDLVPVGKLKDFLVWRKKEFIEKYEGDRYSTENDRYSCLEAQLQNGKPLIAIINTTLLAWDRKASHPWIVTVDVAYTGDANNNMPDNTTYELLNKLEDELLDELSDDEGYLNIGRQTADGVREIYFACKDFRKPSKVLYRAIKAYADQFQITYDIYKDKYWRSFERFRVV